MKPLEEAIQSAIGEFREEGSTQIAAAKRWGVPTSTLSDRLHGSQSNKQAKKDAQKLTDSQEKFLLDWLLSEEQAARAPSRSRIQFFAQSILLEGGGTTRLGLLWVDRFLKRHNKFGMKNSVLLESARVRGSTREAYEDFFQRLEDKITLRGIIPANIANMDEHGMQEMESSTGKVIGTTLTKKAYIETPEGTTWVSVIECVTVEGKRLGTMAVLLVFFPGAPCQGTYYWRDPENRKHYKLDTSVLTKLVDYAEEGNTLRTHGDVPPWIRELIYAKEQQDSERRKRKRQGSFSESLPPIHITNVIPARYNQVSGDSG